MSCSGCRICSEPGRCRGGFWNRYPKILACLSGWASFTVGTIKTLTPALKIWHRWQIGLATMMMAASSFAAELPALLEYRVGDQAEADIVTPVPLVVFDPARTEGLRKAEAQDVNPVFRFLPAAAQQSEADLRSAFTNAQAHFTAGLERLFGHPLPLLNAEFGQQHYNEFLKAYRGQNPAFPLTAQLAELWALGDEGDIALERHLARLRRFTNSFVRPDALPAGERLTAASVRLIAFNQTNAPLTLALVDKQGRNIPHTNLVTLGQLQQDAQKTTNASELLEARHVAGAHHGFAVVGDHHRLTFEHHRELIVMCMPMAQRRHRTWVQNYSRDPQRHEPGRLANPLPRAKAHVSSLRLPELPRVTGACLHFDGGEIKLARRLGHAAC